MYQTKPQLNIVLPNNLKQIFQLNKSAFSLRLSQLLETKQVASIRVKTSDLDQGELTEVINHVKQINKDEVPLLLENDIHLVTKLKLDGVHLTSGQKLVKTAKLTLGQLQLVGAFCGLSKHAGLVAAEHGANYVAFKADHHPLQTTDQIIELFKWWSEFIEIPLMGECSNNYFKSSIIRDYCDFFSLTYDIWNPEVTITSLFKLLNCNPNL